MSKIPFSESMLGMFCGMPEEAIPRNRAMTEIKGTFNSAWFQDNNSNVLAVAHMDTVQQHTTFGGVDVPKDRIIYSPKLDDRLGVYTSLHLLPRLGIKPDILLTTGEETAQSSARLFKSTKQYNWIVSFDRMGEDVVTYGMATPEFESAMESVGMNLGIGSYSDIVELQSLRCCAMNVGVGYADCHSTTAHMYLSQYVRNMKRFVRFYKYNKDKAFPCDTNSASPGLFGYSRYARFEIDESTGIHIDHSRQRCPNCSMWMDYEGHGRYYCFTCGQLAEYSYSEHKAEAIYMEDEDSGTDRKRFEMDLELER